MEKADILEMTVAHLKFIHSARRSFVAAAGRGSCHAADVPTTAPTVADEASGGAATLRYLMGYNECVREVASYLAADDGEAGAGRLGDDVRAALMGHLDDCLRVRAAAPIVAANRLPSPNAHGACGRLDVPASDSRIADIRTSSPPSIELAVDLAGATPWRHRCDSGVYSGASSPAQADELAAVAAALPSPLELTTRTRDLSSTTSTMIGRDAFQLQQPPQTPDVIVSTDVWRPW